MEKRDPKIEEKKVKEKTLEEKTEVKKSKKDSENKAEDVEVRVEKNFEVKEIKADSEKESKIKDAKREAENKSEVKEEETISEIDSKTEGEKSEIKSEPTEKIIEESSEKESGEKVVEEFRSISRRSFLGLGIGGILGGGAYYWLRTSSDILGVEAPFRYSHQFNEFLAKKYFSHSRLAVEYPKSAVQDIRANGFVGLAEDKEIGDWKLEVVGTQKSTQDSLKFSLEDIKKLPKQDISINFKCIEGWSRVMNYVGVRFSDFISVNNLFDVKNLTKYVSLATPDEKYYVGLDMESAMHPQTLLCYEMNGEALEPENGFPLRLLIPTKYGIKNLKRIGTIKFTNERPADYWAERGYDWYAGL